MDAPSLRRDFGTEDWALILGGSSGFGLATAQKLAAHGMSVCVVHRDLRSATERVERGFDAVRAAGGAFLSINTDALSAAGRAEILRQLRAARGERGKVKLLLHSIALGNLRPLVHASEPALRLGEEELAGTLHAMGTSLVTWVQALLDEESFAPAASVVALTSEGARLALPSYAAVGAAKACLESLVRSLAVELAPRGLRCNAIQAGVTDTPALRRIRGHEQLLERAALRNPCGRRTLPEDVANAIYLLALPEARWINGAVIPVDGGESIAALPITED
ncbi:MAG: SDR family oxidoreductase [Planctomycetes bacterium]|nr:SDR family oxidoreductase [Planctomycetota bacterium]